MDKKKINAKIKPSNMKYIGVWMLCGIINNILITILDTMLYGNIEDPNFYFMVSSFLTVPIVSSVYILVYNAFPSLNMKSVMTYIYILGGLGLLKNFGEMSRFQENLGSSLIFYYITFTAAYFCIAYIIRNYYVDNPERWY
jgi:hypothetical protein